MQSWSSRKEEVERCEEIELNGVGEERDDMSDEGGDKIDYEEELAAPDWRARAGPRNKPTQRGERRARSNTRAVPRLVRTLHDGKGSHHHHIAMQKSEDESRRPTSPWIISS